MALKKRIMLWRIKLARWLVPQLFLGSHDMCASIIPFGDDDLDINDRQMYRDAWVQVIGYVFLERDDEWSE